MPLILPIAIVLLALVATPAFAAETCSVDSMPAARKQRLLTEYTRLKRTQGQSQADAFVKAQGLAYYRELAAKGVCSPSTPVVPPRETASPSPRNDRPVNREGKPCRHLVLENVNVPNPGGSMGYALMHVCKD